MLSNKEYAAHRNANTLRCPRCESENIGYYFPDDPKDNAFECMSCRLWWKDLSHESTTTVIIGYEVFNLAEQP